MIPPRPSRAIPAATLVIAMAACAVLAPPRAAAGVVVTVAMPDSARLASLREMVASAPALRVVGGSGKERIAEPILNSSGVRSAAWEPVASTLVGTLIGSQHGFRPIYRVEPGLEAARSASVSPRAPRRAARLAAGLGAALAWDLADLPRHHARLPEPVGGSTAGAAFLGGAMITTRSDESEGAIGALMHRWNTLYPPYALEEMNDH